MVNRITILSWTLICCIILSFQGTTVQASEPAAFQLTTNVDQININESVTITVQANGVQDVSAYEVILQWDSSLIEPVGAPQNKLAGQGIPVNKTESNQMTCAFALKSDQPAVNGNSKLCTFVFKGKSAGQANVKLASVKLLDSNLRETHYVPNQSLQLAITSNNGNPSNPSSPTTPPQGDTSEPGSITIVTTPGIQGTTTVNMPSDTFDKAIHSAKNGIVTVKVEGAETSKQVVIQFSSQQLRDAKEAGIDKIEMNTGIATVTIFPESLTETGSKSGVVELTVSRVEPATLSDAVKKFIGNHTVYDFKLTVDGQTISKFGNGRPIVAIPYTLLPGESPHQVVIYYLSNDGKLEIVKNGKYNAVTGMVEFKPAHFSQYAAVDMRSKFIDLGTVPWAKDDIEGLESRQVVSGISEGQFSPQSQVSRAEFIQMLMGALDVINQQATSTFSDVEQGAWYEQAVASAQQLGIVNGKEDGSYGINEKISRQDMAVMIYRMAQKSGMKLPNTSSTQPFTDQSIIVEYAKDAVSALRQAGIVTGMEDGSFAPSDYTTRAQAAVMIYRIFNLAR
jgi:endo-1,4-beta-xylanase